MTEKRFRFQCDEYNAWSVWDNENVVVYDLNTKYDAEVVCKALNELSDENEQLKKDNTNLHRDMSKDRVNYLKFRDKVFDLIDKKIKEVDTIGAEVLKNLRRELME